MPILPDIKGNFIHTDELSERWNYSPKHCLRVCRVYGLNETIMLPGGKIKFSAFEIRALEKQLFNLKTKAQ